MYTGSFTIKGVRVPATVIGVHSTRVLLQGIFKLLFVTFAGLTNVQYCSLLDWGPERFLMKSIPSFHDFSLAHWQELSTCQLIIFFFENSEFFQSLCVTDI